MNMHRDPDGLQGSKILVVDDEQDVADLVAYNLKAQGAEVRTLANPLPVLGVARSFMPDLLILDVMMPGLDGLQICRMVKVDSVLKDLPIILLTARAEEEDRIQGFETGADDYVCKPFSPRELSLRAKNLLRRRIERPIGEKRYQAGPILLDESLHEVRVDGIPVELTATEFRLLSVLLQRRGRVQSREQLLVSVWNYDESTETRTVDTHIRRLREKLGAAGGRIETVRGVGYRIATAP